MFYLNKKTGAFGITFQDAQQQSGLSVPAECKEFGDFITYEETVAPELIRWQIVRESAPKRVAKNWLQTWEIIDLPLSLDEKKAELKAEIDLIAKKWRDQSVANISPAEMASWPIKRAEAMLFRDGGLVTDAPLLVSEAIARGVSLDALADKVLEKSVYFTQVEAEIAGTCGALSDAVTIATELTIAAVALRCAALAEKCL